MKNETLSGDAFVFVYKKGSTYKCLCLEHTNMHNLLIEEGWEHTATIGADIWVQAFLNGGDPRRAELINNISER